MGRESGRFNALQHVTNDRMQVRLTLSAMVTQKSWGQFSGEELMALRGQATRVQSSLVVAIESSRVRRKGYFRPAITYHAVACEIQANLNAARMEAPAP